MSVSPRPSLTLCADDFAHSTDTSRIIADLLATGKLNATGCMTVRPNWAADAAMLRDVPAAAQIGVHLVLTEESPLTAMPRLAPGGTLPGVHALERIDGRDLPLDEIAREVDAQLDRFTQVMGRAPDFVDGHQHSHALPRIRDVVVAAVARHAPGAWLRSCEDRIDAMLARPWRGKALASAFRSRGFGRVAGKGGLRTNRSFAGHYGFAGDYAAIFPAFLRRPGHRHLVMCHPGSDRRVGDAIAAARPIEAAALRRLPIGELAAEHGLSFP